MTGKIRLIAFLAAILVILAMLGTLGVSASTTYNATEVYKSGKYYRNLCAVELCGDGAQDTLAIALSQLGYHEGDSDAEFDGSSTNGNRDFVEYNVLYGKLDNNQGNGLSYGYYWCASFVNWCLRQAEVSKEASAAAEVSCRRWLDACKSAGIYNGKNGYTPKSADLIFFKDKDSLVTTTHIGLVLYSDGENVYTIEGNTSNGSEFSSDGNYVALKSYPLTSSYIVGYASPNYNTVDGIDRVDYSGRKFSEGKYITTDEIYVYSDATYKTRIGKIEPFTVFSVESVIGNTLLLDGGCIKNENIVQISTKSDKVSLSYTDLSGKRLYATAFASLGETVTLTASIPKRTGVEFLGWAIAGQNKLYSPSESLTLSKNTELIAIYSDSIMPDADEVGTEFIYIEPVEETTEAKDNLPGDVSTNTPVGDGFENLGSTNGNAFTDAFASNDFLDKYGDIIAISVVLFMIILIFLAIRRAIRKKEQKRAKGGKRKNKKKNSRSKKTTKKKKSKSKKTQKSKKDKK